MMVSRFPLREPVERQLLKNSYRLKLDLLCISNVDGNPPGTIEAGYIIEGQVTIKPGDDDPFLSQLIRAFREAQVAKGGCDEIEN